MFAVSLASFGWIILAVIVVAFAGWFFLSKGLNWLGRNKKA